MPKNKQAPTVQNQQHPVSQQIVHGVAYSGPVPPPAVMEQMEKILPGAADRIFKMAEKDQDAQISIIQTRDRRVHLENMTALWMAFVVSLVFVGCGTFLVSHGHIKTGASLLGVTLLGVVGSFLYRWKTTEKK